MYKSQINMIHRHPKSKEQRDMFKFQPWTCANGEVKLKIEEENN